MQKYIPYILLLVIALMIIFWPQKTDVTRFERQQFWDSISLEKKTAKISVLREYNKYMSIYIDSLQDAVRRNDSLHSVEILAIQTKTQKELKAIRENYIVSGSDSSELLQEVTLYKELDHCTEQRELGLITIRSQQIKINNLDGIIESYQFKESIYNRMIADRDKRIGEIEKTHKKELTKTKILAGVIVVIVISLSIVFGN